MQTQTVCPPGTGYFHRMRGIKVKRNSTNILSNFKTYAGFEEGEYLIGRPISIRLHKHRGTLTLAFFICCNYKPFTGLYPNE